MLNPLLFIPYILNPIINTIVTYSAIALGIVPRLSGTEVSWTVPQVLSGFLAQGWQGSVLQIVLITSSTLIWYPFFKIVDKRIAAQEQLTEQEEAEENAVKGINAVTA